MTTVSRLLRLAAEDMEELEARNAELAGQLAIAQRSAATNLRSVYRRGYSAGYGAGRRGAVLETAPERHARGELREALS
jgi:hypothetical protein